MKFGQFKPLLRFFLYISGFFKNACKGRENPVHVKSTSQDCENPLGGIESVYTVRVLVEAVVVLLEAAEVLGYENVSPAVKVCDAVLVFV